MVLKPRWAAIPIIRFYVSPGQTNPVRYRYEPTDKAWSLLPLLREATRWGATNLDNVMPLPANWHPKRTDLER